MTGTVYLLYVLEVLPVRMHATRWHCDLTVPYTEEASDIGRKMNARAVTLIRLVGTMRKVPLVTYIA
jgi:hypothetical protein